MRRRLSLLLVVMFIAAYAGAALYVQMRKPREMEALIIDPLHLEGDTFTQRCSEMLSKAGFNVFTLSGSEVTVGALKRLPEADFLILRAHSSVFNDGVWFFTAEPYDNRLYVPEQLLNDVHIGRTNPDSAPVFAVGARFVGKYFKDLFMGAPVLLMGCDGLKATELAEAFIQIGASAYMSWDGPVTLEFTDEASLYVIQRFLQFKQLSEAVEGASGIPGNVFGVDLRYYPEGASGFRFTLKPT